MEWDMMFFISIPIHALTCSVACNLCLEDSELCDVG